MYRKSAWQSVGGYSRAMRGYEDWEFWISLGEVGVIAQIPDVLLHYQFGAGGRLFSSSFALDTELRAQIVQLHPDLYESSALELSTRVLAGRAVSPEELLASESTIFQRSRAARAYARSVSCATADTSRKPERD
jgi:hypothetical protein